MKNKKIINLIFWISITSAIILRFSHLDTKVFWHDEIHTELRISGYKNIDPMNARLGKILSKKNLLVFQGVSDQKGLKDTLSSLSEDVHTPLYFILLKYWQDLWGNSITAIRSLSAIFGVLCLPALYLLSRQLFKSEQTAKIVTSFLAVSPMFIRYSQDARPYSLWALSAIISTYLLVMALKKNAIRDWFNYSVSIVFTCYSQLLSIYIYLGHCLYVLICKKTNPKALVKYAISSAIGGLLFIPWLVSIVIPNLDSMKAQTAWMKISMPYKLLFKEQIINLNHLFVSLDFQGYTNSLKYIIGLTLIYLIIYSIYITVSKNDLVVWLLPTALSISSFIFLYQDLVLGGQRTRINQYFLLSYVAIFIVVGFTVSFKMISQNQKQVISWTIIYCIIIASSLFTNYQTMSEKTWWGWSSFEVEMAEIINRTENPLVISQGKIGNIMPLFYLLKDNSRSLMLDPNDQTLPKGMNNSEIFFLNPSPEIRKTYEQLSDQSLDMVYKYQENFIKIELYKEASQYP